jgi:hypothetical protein
MKERPILFQGAMVRALLDGSKTQTRRIAKPRRKPSLLDGWTDGYVLDPGNSDWLMADNPYGQPGDRLWVRETFADIGIGAPNYIHQADANEVARSLVRRWKPSIHMPRAASRIMLEVVSVRIERLREISEPDARAEGIVDGGCVCCGEPEPCGCPKPSPDARDAYVRLWESINGASSWNANPWVWVVEFRRIAA